MTGSSAGLLVVPVLVLRISLNYQKHFNIEHIFSNRINILRSNKLPHFFSRCSRQLRQFNLNKKWMTSRTSNTDQ